MPTGYTAGILDGQIKTFEQFAKLCMRNFGATIHMRDDSMSAEYTPRTPSDYHIKAIAQANKTLEDLKTLSDEEIINNRKAELLASKKYHLEKIEGDKKGASIMYSLLGKAQSYVPPTKEHQGIKSFMIEQLESTIRHDCDSKYHNDKLNEIHQEYNNLNAATLRKQMEKQAYKDLAYHNKEHAAELQRCEESNRWVEQFIKSLV